MGQNGSLTFYTARTQYDPKDTLRALLRIAEPEHLLAPFRSVGEDREWEQFLNGAPDVKELMFPRPASTEELVDLYTAGTCLSVSLAGSPLGNRIEAAVSAAIPTSIRGDFVPADLHVRIGYHDLWENSEHEDGLLIARPFLSVSFFGYSTPTHWKAFREAVFQIPEVKSVKRNLESVTGPLEQCIIWSV